MSSDKYVTMLLTELNRTVKYYQDNPDKLAKLDKAHIPTDMAYDASKNFSQRNMQKFMTKVAAFEKKWKKKAPKAVIFDYGSTVDDSIEAWKLFDLAYNWRNSAIGFNDSGSAEEFGGDDSYIPELIFRNHNNVEDYENYYRGGKDKTIEYVLNRGNKKEAKFWRKHYDEYMRDTQSIIKSGLVLSFFSRGALTKRALMRGIDVNTYASLIQKIVEFKEGTTGNNFSEEELKALQKMTVTPGAIPKKIYRGIQLEDYKDLGEEWRTGEMVDFDQHNKVSSWSTSIPVAVSFMKQEYSPSEGDAFVLISYEPDPSEVVADFRSLPELSYWAEQELLLDEATREVKIETLIDAGEDKENRYVDVRTAGPGSEIKRYRHYNQFRKGEEGKYSPVTQKHNADNRNNYILSNFFHMTRLPIDKASQDLAKSLVDMTVDEVENALDQKVTAQKDIGHVKYALIKALEELGYNLNLIKIIDPNTVLTGSKPAYAIKFVLTMAKPNRFEIDVIPGKDVKPKRRKWVRDKLADYEKYRTLKFNLSKLEVKDRKLKQKVTELNRSKRYYLDHPERLVKHQLARPKELDKETVAVGSFSYKNLLAFISKVKKFNEKWAEAPAVFGRRMVSWFNNEMGPLERNVKWQPSITKEERLLILYRLIPEDQIKMFRTLFQNKNYAEKMYEQGEITSVAAQFITKHFKAMSEDVQNVEKAGLAIWRAGASSDSKAYQKGIEPMTYERALEHLMAFVRQGGRDIDEKAREVLKKMFVEKESLPDIVYRGIYVEPEDDETWKKWVEGKKAPIKFTRATSWSSKKEVAVDFMGKKDKHKRDDGLHVMLSHKLTDPNLVIADLRNVDMDDYSYWGEQEIIMDEDVSKNITIDKVIQYDPFSPKNSGYEKYKQSQKARDFWFMNSMNTKKRILVNEYFSLPFSGLPKEAIQIAKRMAPMSVREVEHFLDYGLYNNEDGKFNSVSFILHTFINQIFYWDLEKVISPTEIKVSQGGETLTIKLLTGSFYNIEMEIILDENMFAGGAAPYRIQERFTKFSEKFPQMKFKFSKHITEANRPQKFFAANPDKLKTYDFAAGPAGSIRKTSANAIKKYLQAVKNFRQKWKAIAPDVKINELDRDDDAVDSNYSYVHGIFPIEYEIIRSQQMGDFFLWNDGERWDEHLRQEFFATVIRGNKDYRKNPVFRHNKKFLEFMMFFGEEYQKDLRNIISKITAISSNEDIKKMAIHKGLNPNQILYAMNQLLDYVFINTYIQENLWEALHDFTVDPKKLPKKIYRGIFIEVDDSPGFSHHMSTRKFLSKWKIGLPPPHDTDNPTSWSMNKDVALTFARQVAYDDKDGYHVIMEHDLKDPSMVLADTRQIPFSYNWAELEIVMKPGLENVKVAKIMPAGSADMEDMVDKQKWNIEHARSSHMIGILADEFFRLSELQRDLPKEAIMMFKKIHSMTVAQAEQTFNTRFKLSDWFQDVRFPLYSFIEQQGISALPNKFDNLPRMKAEGPDVFAGNLFGGDRSKADYRFELVSSGINKTRIRVLVPREFVQDIRLRLESNVQYKSLEVSVHAID